MCTALQKKQQAHAHCSHAPAALQAGQHSQLRDVGYLGRCRAVAGAGSCSGEGPCLLIHCCAQDMGRDSCPAGEAGMAALRTCSASFVEPRQISATDDGLLAFWCQLHQHPSHTYNSCSHPLCWPTHSCRSTYIVNTQPTAFGTLLLCGFPRPCQRSVSASALTAHMRLQLQEGHVWPQLRFHAPFTVHLSYTAALDRPHAASAAGSRHG